MKFISVLKSGLLALVGSIALFSALPALAQEEGYRIRAGDVLKIEILEDGSLNRSALVSPDGRITMPLAGTFRAAGATVESVAATLSDKLKGNFAVAPTVIVSIERVVERAPSTGVAQVATMSIFVIGEAGKPGKMDLAPGSTLIQALAQMGGFSKFAATKRIQLRRADASGQETIFKINYDEIVQGGSNIGQTRLMEGDVILVPQRRLFE